MNIIRTAGLALIGGAFIFSTGIGCKAFAEYRKFNKAIEDISDNINAEVPEKIMNAAIEKAANRTAQREADDISRVARTIINTNVNKEIEKVKSEMSDKVKEQLERKISMIEVSEIKEKVTEEVSKMIFKDLVSRDIKPSNDMASIIESCNNAGMSSWEIENILKSIN